MSFCPQGLHLHSVLLNVLHNNTKCLLKIFWTKSTCNFNTVNTLQRLLRMSFFFQSDDLIAVLDGLIGGVLFMDVDPNGVDDSMFTVPANCKAVSK